MGEGTWRRVTTSAAVVVGRPVCIAWDGREVALCRTADGLFAVDDLCTHAEAHLSDGRLKGNRIVCPLHGASFDVRDGRALTRPATTPLATYAVREEDGIVLLGPRHEGGPPPPSPPR